MRQRNDDEYQWLIDNGAVAGQLNDMWFERLRAWGYVGALDDMKFQFWAAGGVPGTAAPPIVIIQDGVRFVAGHNATRTGYRRGQYGTLVDPSTFPDLRTIRSRSDGRVVLKIEGDYSAETLTGMRIETFTPPGIHMFGAPNFESFDGTVTTWRWNGAFVFVDGQTYEMGITL